MLTVAKTSIAIVVGLVVAGVAGFAFSAAAHVTCDALIGKWAWFIGGEVTVNPDGTFVQQSGNDGTWECTDATGGRVTLRWRLGGYVNRLALSADGQDLSSTDPSQPFVTAKRIGAGGAAQSETAASVPPGATTVILTTQPDGARQLPKDLPELMHAAAERARLWRPDAIPVALEFQYREAPNPMMRGPAVRISFISPAAGTGLFATVTTDGMRTFEVNKPVHWGAVSLPPVFVDLPAAVRIARKRGMQGPVSRARLNIWSPGGAPPVLAWIVGDQTVNGATGEIIGYDVTGYIASYNAQWEHAAKGLRALMRSAQGGSSSGSSPPIGGDSSSPGSGPDKPYDDGSAARAEYERRAAEARAYWNGSAADYNRIKNGECTWRDSSNFGC
jgi:hypothetical protein